MPSARKQVNIRIDPETEATLPLLSEAITALVGIEVTNTDLFRMGISELKKRYLPHKLTEADWQTHPASAVEEKPAPAKKGKPKKK